MRTTLAIDDDVLAAANELAAHQNKSVDEVITSLARQALKAASTHTGMRNGIPLLLVRSDAGVVTPELVKQLHDALS